MKYRAEIDGLRALAVVPVILFHAGFEIFSGGFVGVDVFFVISGYLITTILIEDIENKRISIVNFYERRARRILPGLLFVMLLCIPFSWLWMLPSQMKEFSQSLVAVSLFASNILFWRESGYFDIAAEEKPLLHTWSLAVEEQYYVLFPIFLIFAWRSGKSRVFWMIVVMATISLLLSEWGWRNQPTANFYLAPTRAWELFAGSLAAFVVQKQGVQKNNLLALIGLAAIFFSIFFYDESTPFPSVYALVPALGVVLIVLYADKETFVAKFLSTKAFVGIGLISYSAYLWHQPLFAFARIKSVGSPSNFVMASLALISLALAFASWRYIEKPFRNKRFIEQRKLFSFLVASMLVLVFFGSYFALQSDGELYKKLKTVQFLVLDKDTIKEREMVYFAKEEFETKSFSDCLVDISQNVKFSDGVNNCIYSKAILLFGDSHSRDVYQALGQAKDRLRSGLLILSAHKGGCRITEDEKPHCRVHYEKVRKFINDMTIPVDTIVYTQAARTLIGGDGRADLNEAEKLLASLDHVSDEGLSVLWLGPRASIGISREEAAKLCMSREGDIAKIKKVKEKFVHSTRVGVNLDNDLRSGLDFSKFSTNYVSQVELLGQESSKLSLVTDCQYLYWSNSDHLSRYGERKFATEFISFFNQL